MKALVFMVLVALAGCSTTLDQDEINKALEYCKDKEGLFSIKVYSDSAGYYVTCKNGADEGSNNLQGLIN